jgi:glycosyltransferase involved in cell wall biosynthesis
LDLGGSERHLALIAPRLRRLGWNPIIYCLSRKGHQAKIVADAGVEVLGPPYELAQNQGWLFGRLVTMALSVLELAWLMISRRPAIVHFYLPTAYLIGAPIALLTGVPVRIMSRRSLNRYQAGHPFVSRIENRLHRRMSAVLGNSERVVRELIETENCPAERVELIYNGVDVATIQAAPPAPRPSGRGDVGSLDFVLVTVANLIPYKGHADLLRALAGISDRLPPRWRLLCVGRDDGCGEGLKEQARDLGLDDHVEWLGQRDDVASLLKAADIGILCSHEEGFANAILEGMAVGLPMIVTDVGGNAEAVSQGVTGLVVPPHDSEALGRAIVELAGDPTRREAMGGAARARAERDFDIATCVAAYDRLYDRLTKPGHA